LNRTNGQTWNTEVKRCKYFGTAGVCRLPLYFILFSFFFSFLLYYALYNILSNSSFSFIFPFYYSCFTKITFSILLYLYFFLPCFHCYFKFIFFLKFYLKKTIICLDLEWLSQFTHRGLFWIQIDMNFFLLMHTL
jgi:hypothetical protein